MRRIRKERTSFIDAVYEAAFGSEEVKLMATRNATFCMQMKNKVTKCTKVEKGARRRGAYSPDFFNLYNEIILRELVYLSGFNGAVSQPEMVAVNVRT